MLKMLTDYMEGGLLENIIALFRKDENLFPLIGEMLGDERGRVRLGTIALVETLMTEQPDTVLTAIPGIAKLLNHPNPTIRGDAAHTLGVIGHKDALNFLTEAALDENELVKQIAEESIDMITSSRP